MKSESVRSILLAALAVTSLTTCSFLTGCKPSQEEVARQEMQAQQALEDLRQQIQSLTSEGKWDAALEQIQKALTNPDFASVKGMLLGEKIAVYLGANRLDEAKAEARTVLSDSPADFYPCAEKVYAFEMEGKQYKRALDWCKLFTATDIELPEGVKESLLFDQLEPAMILKDKAETLLVLNTLRPQDEMIRSRLEGVLIRQIERGDPTFLSPIFQDLQKSATEPAVAKFYLTVLLRSEVARKDWGASTQLLPLCINLLSDNELTRCCRVLFSGMKKAKVTPQLENAAKIVITQAKDKGNAANLAARVWVDSGVRKDLNLLPVRLDALLAAKINPNQVGDLLDQYFYRKIDDRNLVNALSERGEKLIPLCTDTNTVNALKVKVLDGAFITEDYAKAVRMLEKGIPGKEKVWHEMSIPKVKAHLALKQNEPRKAIAHFREFMQVWKAQKQDEEFDPTTGIAHSKEWILARNALRIAKIYDSIPDAVEAKKARAEAKDYYVKAQAKAAKDEEALKLLKKEFAELN